MGKYGFQSAQGGIPLRQAADYQLTMDDRWPVVDFLFMDIMTFTNVQVPAAGSTYYFPIYKHDLGYAPGFFLKDISFSGFSSSNQNLEQIALADEHYIYIPIPHSGAITVNMKFWISIMERDISQEFQAPIETPLATSASTASAYGLRIMPHPVGAGMDQLDKSVFSFNTNAKSIAIQAHGIRTAQASGTYAGYLLIDHKLGYPPTYFLARRITIVDTSDPMNGKTLQTALDSGRGIGFSDGTTLRIRGAQATFTGSFAFIILKDPVDTAA